MGSIPLLVFSVIYYGRPAIAIPSSNEFIPKPVHGHEVESQYLGRVLSRNLFGRGEEIEECTTDSCKRCDNCDPYNLKGKASSSIRRRQPEPKRVPQARTKPDPFKVTCIPDPDNPANNNEDSDQKGQCPDGKILDPAEGGQDKNTANPICVPDDKCDSGSVPTSRKKSDTDGTGTVRCVKDIKEDGKPKCKSYEYRYVMDNGGNAEYSCRKTRKFDREKEGKFEDTKKRKKEERERQKKEKEEEEKRRKEEAKKDRKKERMGKCLPLVSLSMGYPEDGFPQATDFFDEEYIDSEDVMMLWPSELDDVPDINIDTDEYINDFLEAMDDLLWIPWGGGGAKKRKAASSASEMPPSTMGVSTSTDIAIRPRETGLAGSYEKRFVKALFTAIRNFLVRAVTWLGRQVNRLQALKDKGGPRIAEKGKGAKYGDQKKAGDDIAKDKNWKNCINGKKPEKNGPTR
ncbi:hypothetical protein K458DRAFT_490712 [Lentithecium fluviatile CBS 122367]|uniref:Uncharacterized protein n=1 Tax=Lentithecium fluviatile CBS 122367 TaxID=1168545 RepID=A0A6G1IML1_9PLEO|nr:hypothetical protein K458DRAFT_490712 [Lentithecium fluviatile CBS 122367]